MLAARVQMYCTVLQNYALSRYFRATLKSP